MSGGSLCLLVLNWVSCFEFDCCCTGFLLNLGLIYWRSGLVDCLVLALANELGLIRGPNKLIITNHPLKQGDYPMNTDRHIFLKYEQPENEQTTASQLLLMLAL